MKNKIKALVVDDSVIYRTQIRNALEGISDIESVTCASSGKTGLEKMENSLIDLLVLDLEMPEMNGLEVLEEMRKRKVSCKTLVFSSFSQKGSERVMKALELGAIDFLMKPDANSDAHRSPELLIRDIIAPKLKELFINVTSKEKVTPVKM